jgi:GNAT superfamily N-acetyltransferase
MEESAYLLTVPLAKNDGMTLWVLVEKYSILDQRAILASCESFRKRALVSTSDGTVEDGVVHSIASVFCDPKYRGKGYAKRMLKELASVLEHWQVGEGEKCVGSVLYSDIGKKYYADIGWRPAINNSHIEFPAQHNRISDGVKLLQASDLEELCLEDEDMIRRDMVRPSVTGKQRMVIIPDHDHMLWHHTKEEFVSKKLFGRIPQKKGVLVGQPGKRVWATWTHRFYSDPEAVPSGNVLYILRLVIEDLGRDGEELQGQLKLIFQTAQAEAKAWNLDVVKLWDPHPRVQRLVRRMGIDHSIVDRDDDGIASLLWYGEKQHGRPEWVANEKYAWC